MAYSGGHPLSGVRRSADTDQHVRTGAAGPIHGACSERAAENRVWVVAANKSGHNQPGKTKSVTPSSWRRTAPCREGATMVQRSSMPKSTRMWLWTRAGAISTSSRHEDRGIIRCSKCRWRKRRSPRFFSSACGPTKSRPAPAPCRCRSRRVPKTRSHSRLNTRTMHDIATHTNSRRAARAVLVSARDDRTRSGRLRRILVARLEDIHRLVGARRRSRRSQPRGAGFGTALLSRSPSRPSRRQGRPVPQARI